MTPHTPEPKNPPIPEEMIKDLKKGGWEFKASPSSGMEWEKQLIEQLADIEHQRWADWQKYMHTNGTPSLFGNNLVFDKETIERWEIQIKTPYSNLTEREKEEDRKQVLRYFPLISQAISEAKEETRKECYTDLRKDLMSLDEARADERREVIDKVLELLSTLNVVNNNDAEWHAGVSASIDVVEGNFTKEK